MFKCNDMPHKTSRAIGAITALLLVMLPLYIFHGRADQDWMIDILFSLPIVLIFFCYDHDMIETWLMERLWIVSLAIAGFMLPITVVQGPTVGYMLAMIISLVLSPVGLQEFLNLWNARRELRSLGRKESLYYYSDAYVMLPVMLLVWVILSVISGGEALVVVPLWIGILGVAIHFTIEEANTLKSILSSELRKIAEEKVEEEEEYHD